MSVAVSVSVRPARSFAPRPAALRRSAGFTLVEAMMAASVFTMVALSVYAMLIKSYQMAALTRTRDDARAVLRTYADQFQRLQTTASVGNTTYNRWLFNPTNADSGRGLVWGVLNDANTSTPAEDVTSLALSLGGSGHAIPATVTRDVRYVDPASGATANAQTIEAAGYLIQATFKVTYRLNQRIYVESLTVLRAAP